MNFEHTHYQNSSLVMINLSKTTAQQAPEFKNYLMDLIGSGKSKLIVDCRMVEYMDSTFLGAIVFALKKSSAAGGDVRIVRTNLELPVWDMFQLTNMNKIFKIFSDLETAVESYEEAGEEKSVEESYIAGKENHIAEKV